MKTLFFSFLFFSFLPNIFGDSFDYDLRKLSDPYKEKFGVCCSETYGKEFAISNGWANDPAVFDCMFSGENVFFDSQGMHMRVDDVGCPENCNGTNYRCAEVWAIPTDFSYGYYAAQMKLPKNAEGLMSGSVFMYAANDQGLEHDEIDIEFAGVDADGGFWVGFFYDDLHTGIQYVKLKDIVSSDGFNEYGFVWEKDCITWYVNRKKMKEMCRPIMPDRKGRFYMNIWPGNMTSTHDMQSWLGNIDYNAPYELVVRRIMYLKDRKKPPPYPPNVWVIVLVVGGSVTLSILFIVCFICVLIVILLVGVVCRRKFKN